MSARSPPNIGGSSTRVTITAQSSSQSNDSDWVGISLLAAKAVAAGAECLPFPYVKGVFGLAVILFETVEKVKKNRDDLEELCGDTLEIMKIVRDQILAHGDTAALKFKSLCEDLESGFRRLQDVLNAVKKLYLKPQGIRGCFREIVKLGSTGDQILRYQSRIQKLRSNFMVVLDQMHQYFTADLGKQHNFLLHGLGGSGKTQIALKFIEQSKSQFSDIFFVDASTNETIDTGLKRIAVLKYGRKDAIMLLLTSAAQEMTPANTKIAAGIAKELSYLPLAIIQAGAFISRSGALDSYLTLYLNNRARLLNEKPTQSHDDYAWTVYTTWQISFEKLSLQAATLLQLSSFLHYEGISENIFRKASTYQLKPYGPSKEELQKPSELLSQFVGATGIWDSLQFMDVSQALAHLIANCPPTHTTPTRPVPTPTHPDDNTPTAALKATYAAAADPNHHQSPLVTTSDPNTVKQRCPSSTPDLSRNARVVIRFDHKQDAPTQVDAMHLYSAIDDAIPGFPIAIRPLLKLPTRYPRPLFETDKPWHSVVFHGAPTPLTLDINGEDVAAWLNDVKGAVRAVSVLCRPEQFSTRSSVAVRVSLSSAADAQHLVDNGGSFFGTHCRVTHYIEEKSRSVSPSPTCKADSASPPPM
ncbi:hypothetical protein C8R44DRAFT_753794 [Mycena epipterygia]|nr:hypothetical protein C8R44DRAFT_753794 [Mycena epipterygia]